MSDIAANTVKAQAEAYLAVQAAERALAEARQALEAAVAIDGQAVTSSRKSSTGAFAYTVSRVIA